MELTGSISLLTKDMLFDYIRQYQGIIDEYMHIKKAKYL
jgi:hypothetical protein